MVKSSKLLAKLELEDLNLILREGLAGLGMWSIQWCSQNRFDIQIGGRPGAGRPKLTWKKLTKAAVCGGSQQLTLKKGTPGDQV